MTPFLSMSRLIDQISTWVGKLTMWLILATTLISAGNAWACGTSTAASVPCMFSHLGRNGYEARRANFEGLMDVLQHAGLAVLWVDNQSGCKGTCDRIPNANTSAQKDPELCPTGSDCLDNIMLKGLDQRLADLLETHEEATGWDYTKALSLRVSLSPGDKEQLMDATTHRFAGKKGADLHPMVRWLVENHEFGRVVGMLDLPSIKTRKEDQPLLLNYMSALTMLGRILGGAEGEAARRRALAIALGLLAASLAIATAYIRELGRAEGFPPDFSGPLAKPQRMAVLTAGTVLAAFYASEWTLTVTLWIIVGGTAVTVIRRSMTLINSLKSR